MKHLPRCLALLGLCAAGLLPMTAQAQWSAGNGAQPAPLYAYQLQPGQPYAMEIAPGTYVIHRPPPPRDYPYVRCLNGCGPRTVVRRHIDRDAPRSRYGVRRHAGKRTVVRIVRDAPLVVEHRRVVEDPPRVIERRHYVDDTPAPTRRGLRAPRVEATIAPPPRRGRTRVIHADAEITIHGPDRIDIRLIRKRGSEDAFDKK